MKRIYSVVVLVLVAMFFCQPVFATHNMGKDLQYTCLGMVNGQMQYRVTVRYYRNCWDNQFQGPAATAPSSVSLEVSAQNCTGFQTNYNLPLDGSAQPPNGSEVSQLCPSQIASSGCNWSSAGNPPYPGVQIYTYTGIVNVPANCSLVTFGTTECCRNGAINNIPNPGSEDLSIKATVNNTIDPLTSQPYCNNSVVFTNQPVPFFCLGSDVTFNHGGVDVDGDSLVYSLVNPMNGFSLPYANIPFTANYNVNCPIRTSPPNTFQFSTQTGQMQFVPAFQEQDVLAVRVDEYRNGVLVGSTMRDIQVVILNCAIAIPSQNPITNVQNGNQVDSLQVQTCPGTPLEFDILCTDPANHNLIITSNINTAPSAIPGATMTQVGTGDSVIARINWTPQPGDTGCHDFILTAKNNDCPINGTYTRVYSICVFTQVQLLTASTTYCGTPVQLTATGGTNFAWIPSTGPNAVSNPNVYNPVVTPATSTMYYFTSDCGTDSVFVAAAPPFTYDAGQGGSICQNGQLALNATTDNMYAPYHFQWVPGTGLNDPVANVPNDTVPNPVASPLVTTKYYLYVTGSNGCTNIDSLTVNVSGSGPNIVAQATPAAVCPGDPVNLKIVTNPQSCGIAQTPCSGHVVQAQIGTGTGVTPTGSPTQYPTIYGHYSKSARHQFLYLQNEILAIVGSGGTIDSIAFYMDDVNGVLDTMKNFEIKMGCTQATSLTNWQPNLVTVFSPKSVPLGVVDGWVTHRLDFPYDWDGSSNLVIDVCFDNTGSPTLLNKKMQMTPTAFPSVYYSKGNTSQCGITGTPTSSVNRPNIRFNICVTDVSGLPISWMPATGPNAPTPTDTANTTAHPVTPVIYQVDVTANNGCHSNDFVYVSVDTSVRLYAFPEDTFLCMPGSIQLTTTTFGNPLPANNFTYTWTNLNTNTTAGSGATINVNASVNTDYLVMLTGGACTLYDTVHITVGAGMPVNLLLDSISCNGASDAVLHAQINGGVPPITYNWSTGASNIDSIQNLAPGSYSVTVADASGCSGADTVVITEPAALSYTANFTNIICNGANNGSILVVPSGGTTAYNYQWSPAQANTGNLTGLSAGMYSVTVVDAHSCTVSVSSTITEPAPLTVNVTTTNASCDASLDGTALATVTGGTPAYRYEWSGAAGDSVVNSLDNGAYVLLVSDTNNCTVSANFTIDTAYVLHITTTSTNASCFGSTDGTATVNTLNGTTPFSYLWNPSSQSTPIATGLAATNYTVSVTDSKNCTATVTTIITQPTEIVLTFSHTDPLCTGIADGTAGVSATGGTGTYTYDWAYVTGAPDNSTLTGLPAGMYEVTVTDGSNCSVAGNVTLANPPSLDAAFINKKEITCANAMDGSVEVSVSGGTPPIAFTWTNGSTNALQSNLAPGSYSVTVADNNGCDTTLTLSFTAPPLISVALLNADSVSCPAYTDGNIQVSAIGGTPGNTFAYEYSIDGTTFQPSEFFDNLKAGVYHLKIRDSQGCTKDTVVEIYEPATAALSIFPADTTIELGQSILLASTVSNYSAADINFYNWSPVTGLNCTDCSSPVAAPYRYTTYILTVNYLNNCSVSQTANVYVNDGEDFFVPNAFSPNGDGNNDVFTIYAVGLMKANLKIFNRWGEKIYDTNNQWQGWDGTYKGQLQNPGVYTYYVQGVYLNGKEKIKTGSVTLVR